MKVLALQHSAADTPASAGPIIEELGHDLHIMRTVERSGDPIPSTVEADALIIFGGPVSLLAPKVPEWVDQERELVRKYADAGRRVLGICLGSQIVASALGAKIRRNLQREIGWHPVYRMLADANISEAFPDQFMAFHWHQNTFDLPPGAQHLLRSDGCDHQAFVIDDRILGFQFHLEANERTVEAFMMVSDVHNQPGRFVQRQPVIRQGTSRYLASQTEILSNFLQRWLS